MMGRVNAVRMQRDPCPPHAWKDISERAGYYLLRCEKCGDVFPDETRR